MNQFRDVAIRYTAEKAESFDDFWFESCFHSIQVSRIQLYIPGALAME